MDQILMIVFLGLTSLIAYLLSLTQIVYYLPQLLALLALIFIILTRYRLSSIYLISLIVNLIIFSTDGLNSPFFFLVYFLLFSAAFILHPATSLAFTLITVLFLAHSLNSTASLITLLSLLLITPLVWYVSREAQSRAKTKAIVSRDETAFLLWLNLKFKTGITTIIDLASQLHSSPLNYTQQQQLKKIKSSAHSLLNSSQKLTTEISSTPDDTEI